MRVRKDYVIVALPPVPETDAASGLILAPLAPPSISSGRVLRAGPQCSDVRRGDVVAFSPSAGLHDYVIGRHHCVFIHETDISAIIEQESSRA